MQTWMKNMQAKASDLSKEEDLVIGIMNLISLEEHAYFSYAKTGDAQYLHLLETVRELRKTAMKMVVTDPQGEEWCMSKHLLAASMRLYETGTKELHAGSKQNAMLLFEMAFELFSQFFMVTKGSDKELRSAMQMDIKVPNKFTSKFSTIIKKIVDCCKE